MSEPALFKLVFLQQYDVRLGPASVSGRDVFIVNVGPA